MSDQKQQQPEQPQVMPLSQMVQLVPQTNLGEFIHIAQPAPFPFWPMPVALASNMANISVSIHSE